MAVKELCKSYTNLNELDQAKNLLKTSLVQTPNEANLWFELMNVTASMNQPEESLEAAKTLSHLEANNPENLAYLAGLYDKTGDQEKAIEKKIQSATFVITNPLPTIALNVMKKEVVSKPYHVVAGAFQFPENAEKKVNQLKKQGYKASILGANKWGLIEVAFDSFLDKNEAINNLYKIQATVSEDAWLLIKK